MHNEGEFELSSTVIIQTRDFCIVVMSQICTKNWNNIQGEQRRLLFSGHGLNAQPHLNKLGCYKNRNAHIRLSDIDAGKQLYSVATDV
jgi:hypothetical protein